jgi:4-amino-4-deoxy-L-arabinose transferase-like glycosyltransferase
VDRHTLRPIVILALVAFVARIGFLVVFGGLDNDIHDSMADQYTYLDIADNLAAGEGFVVSNDVWMADAGEPTSIVSPLYPVFLAPIVYFFGDSLVAIRLINVLLSMLMVVGVYLIGRILFNERVALIAGAITAVYPAFVMYVRPIMSESISFPLVVLLVLLAALLLTRAFDWRLFALYGVTGGLLILVKPEVALLIALLMLAVMARYWKLNRYQMLSGAALATVVTAVVILPYCLYNLNHHGQFTPLPNKRWAFWDGTWLAEMETHDEWRGVALPERRVIADWDAKSEVERDQELYAMAREFVIDNPGIYAKQRVRALYRSFPLLPVETFGTWLGLREPGLQPDGAAYGATSLDDIVQYVTTAELIRVWTFRVIFAAALVGFVMSFRTMRAGTVVVGIVFLWSATLAALVGGAERYRLQIDPFLILLAAVSLSALWFRFKSWQESARAIPHEAHGTTAG